MSARGAPAVRGPATPVAALALALLLAAAGGVAGRAAEAVFAVRDEVIAPGIGPFTATVEALGNGSRLVWRGSGFEPPVYRTRWMATEDAPDRIVAAPNELAHWNTLRSGALDGARVDVYRIENGRLGRVRTDRIAAGGFNASGWTSVLPDGRLVPPGATTHSFVFARWNRPGSVWHVAVQAVDRNGRVSAPSAAVAVTVPEGVEDPRAEAPLVEAPERMPPPEAPPHPAGPPAPRDLVATVSAEGVVRLTWATGGGRPAGWRILVSDDPPAAHRGFFALLEGGAAGPAIRAGDLVVVSKTFGTVVRGEVFTNRVWGAYGEVAVLHQPLLGDAFAGEDPQRTWALVPHAPDTPVEEPGATYVEVTLGPRRSLRIGTYNHGGAGQHWYEVLEPGRVYRIEAWVKADRQRGVRFLMDGPHGRPGPDYIRPVVDIATPEWRRLSARFTLRRRLEGREPGWMGIELEGPGVFAVDNLRVFAEDTPWLDLAATDYARLAAARVEALRTHGLIKTFRRTYDLAQLTNPGGVTGIEHGATLPQTLGILARAGIDPWLQIEPHLSPEEWTGLLEYLAAPAPADPAAAPWAAKRVAQGRVAPWTDAFGRIWLEVGNETWNGLFAPWTFPGMVDAATGEWYDPGKVYGLFQEHVIRTLKASPHWAAAGLDGKVVFVLGGWAGTGYGRDAAMLSPGSDLLTIAAYNGGWDRREGPPARDPASFFNVLNQVSQAVVPDAVRLAAEAAAIAAARGRPIAIGTYEAGPGYALDGLNGERVSEEQAAVQEEVMKSLAAGTATLDSFLARAVHGFTVENFFTFGEGRYWRSHARWVEGGQGYPSWELLALWNRVGRGPMLRVDTLATPVADLPAVFGWRRPVVRAPLTAVYASREGRRVTLALVSRLVPGHPAAAADAATAFEVRLPFARAARITRYRLSGAHDDHNAAGPAVTILTESPGPEVVAGGRLRVPALGHAQAEIWVFEDVSGE